MQARLGWLYDAREKAGGIDAMGMERLAIGFVLLAAIGTDGAFAREGQSVAPFDRPQLTQRVKLGKDKEARCFIFAHLRVKEIDAGEVGDEQISVLPLASSAARPPCQAGNAAGEIVIPTMNAGSYFLGVKGEYVFLSAADGVNNGLGFSVYRGADPTNLFRDSVKFDRERTLFRSIALDGTGLRMRYVQVFSGTCSVQTEGAACWAQIAAAAHVPPTPAPDCAAGYLRSKQAMAAARCEIQPRKNKAVCLKAEMDRQAADDASPSVIDHVVDGSLQPPNQTITPVGGALSCRPAD
jgi:hypothetical protein